MFSPRTLLLAINALALATAAFTVYATLARKGVVLFSWHPIFMGACGVAGVLLLPCQPVFSCAFRSPRPMAAQALVYSQSRWDLRSTIFPWVPSGRAGEPCRSTVWQVWPAWPASSSALRPSLPIRSLTTSASCHTRGMRGWACLPSSWYVCKRWA